MTKPDIFLCDDDADFTAELSQLLRARGYEVQALSMVAQLPELTRPAALLLDLCMPKQDGIEALRILSEHAQRDLLNIMFVSGWDEGMMCKAAKLAEARGLRALPPCRKPVELGQVCAILATLN